MSTSSFTNTHGLGKFLAVIIYILIRKFFVSLIFPFSNPNCFSHICFCEWPSLCIFFEEDEGSWLVIICVLMRQFFVCASAARPTSQMAPAHNVIMGDLAASPSRGKFAYPYIRPFLARNCLFCTNPNGFLTNSRRSQAEKV